MQGGTGELETSESESEIPAHVNITVERLPAGISTDPNHPPNYPTQSIRVSTLSTSVVIVVSGFNVQLTDTAIVNIAREILYSARH